MATLIYALVFTWH